MTSVDNRKAKLFQARDIHSELIRKLVGKSHCDKLFQSDVQRSAVFLIDVFRAVDNNLDEILRWEIQQMSIPGFHVGLGQSSKNSSKVHEIASLQADLCREEKERVPRSTDPFDTPGGKDDAALSLELQHNSSFSSGTPTDNWSPFTHFGSNDSCEKEFFPSISAGREHSHVTSSSSHRNSTGRNPLVAKRNSNIDRMLNEVSLRSHSRNQSPKLALENIAPSRFSFFIPQAEKNGCISPPGVGGIASSQALTDAESLSSSTSSVKVDSTTNRRLSNGDKGDKEKRYATLFPTRPLQPKSPVTVPSISLMTREERISYHRTIFRTLAQNISKSQNWPER